MDTSQRAYLTGALGPTRRGGRPRWRVTPLPSAVAALVYAFLHLLLYLWTFTELTLEEFVEEWASSVGLSLSLHGVSQLLAWLLLIFGAVDLWRALSPWERRRIGEAVIAGSAVALCVLLLVYLDRVGDVLALYGGGR